MMRKFTIYNLQFTILILVAVFAIMLAVPFQTRATTICDPLQEYRALSNCTRSEGLGRPANPAVCLSSCESIDADGCIYTNSNFCYAYFGSGCTITSITYNLSASLCRPAAPPPSAAPATACGTGAARSTGLVSTQDVVGNFNTTGACVKDTKAAFAPYKIPSYEDLKSLYFTRSKTAKISSNNANIAPITSSDDGKVFNYTAADVNINGLYNYNGTTVIFIEGNINIRKDIQAQTPAAQGLVFVVKGNVNIDKDVAQINAVIIAEGVIDTAYNAGATTPQLIINGSLVALKDENPIRFSRNLANNNQPAEIINNQPKYLVILRDLYADTLQKWSEIQ